MSNGRVDDRRVHAFVVIEDEHAFLGVLEAEGGERERERERVKE